MKSIENNKVTIIGEISYPLECNHIVYGEKFYETEISVARLSGIVDIIPVIISERLINVNENHIGKIVEIDGQFRSHNQSDDKDRKLKLYVFVRQIEEMDSDTTHKNYIELDGFICKEPVYRTTPLGRNITDCIVACNRPYGKSDYIPCIFWGRTATFISKFNTGKHIKIYGRIQSREYIKKISDEESETRIAYEVSTDKLEVFDAEEE